MYIPKHRNYRLFVPAADSRLGIDPRSAIVAHSPTGGVGDVKLVLCWYEGNRFGADNLKRYVERVNCAAGRADQNYPTIAKQAIAPNELIDVGTYDLQNGQLQVTNPAALSAWLEGESLELALYPHGRP